MTRRIVTGLARTLGLLAAVLLATIGDTARAAERIEAFDVRIDVLADGTLDITETIRVTVEGRQIKRGIYRDFPLERADQPRARSRVTFDVVSVRRNGQAEPYTTEHGRGYARVRIGQADRYLLAPSEQTYEIRYRTQGQLRPFDGYDELYWNVTGNQWAFPIQTASVEIRLPGSEEILQHAAYTGPWRGRGQDFRVGRIGPGFFRASTTAVLPPGHGFTVAIGWPPGTVQVPEVGMVLGQSTLRFAAVGATLVAALLLLAAWVQVGRDPARGAIYARFEPPKGVGPAAARYVQRLGFDGRCLTAAILSMAVKGAVRIVEKQSKTLFVGRRYVLEALGGDGKGLTPGERAAYNRLFAGSDRLELKADKDNGARVDKARSELRSTLWDEHYGASFKRNTVYTLLGALIGIGSAALFFWLADWGRLSVLPEWLLPAALAAAVAYGVGFLAREFDNLRGGGVIHWRRLLPKLIPAIIIAVLAQSMIGALMPQLIGLAAWGDPVVIAAGAVFGMVVVLFHFLMAAPSKAGRKLMDQLEGFALYMRTAEEDRLNTLNPPERTPELFERLLPYAVGLGLTHEWSTKFAGVLSAATMPHWYDGTGHFNVDDFDSGFGQAVASTSKPSSGSSGSGGGGFSGGGGGGGGGGGW